MPSKQNPVPRGIGNGAGGFDRAGKQIKPKDTSAPKIEQAARWYRDHRADAPRPLIPNLARQFGITPAEAAKAIGMAGTVAG